MHPSCRLPLSSLLLLSVLLNLLPSHLVLFLCPLVLPLFHILLLHASGLLHSFYIVCIFFLPLPSSISLLWSRFHIWILPVFFCLSISSSLLGTLVIFLWLYFRSVYYIWIPFSFSPSRMLLFLLSFIIWSAVILFCSALVISVPPFLTSSSPFFLFLALFPSWPFPQVSLSFLYTLLY